MLPCGRIGVAFVFPVAAPSMRAAIGKVPTATTADAEEEAAATAGAKKPPAKAEKGVCGALDRSTQWVPHIEK